MNKIILFLSISFFITNAMAQEKIVQTAGRTQLGEFAPKFAELNDDVLFGEVWSRTDKLGLRDRSLVTITSLISQGITDNSLVFHLQSAKKNGVTRTEIAEIITHIGFYAGWPKAWAAFNLAKDVWAEDAAGEDAKAAFQREMIFPLGEPNTAYAKYFTGNSYLAPSLVRASPTIRSFSIFSRQRRMELPVPRLQKSSPTSVFMPVGRKHGRHLIWPKTYGRKMRLAKMPKPLSNAK